jgi:hypothetical protein
MLNVEIISVIVRSVVLLNALMLSVIEMSAVIPSVSMNSVVSAECCFHKFHNI